VEVVLVVDVLTLSDVEVVMVVDVLVAGVSSS
jgi:hypothetical protein